MSTDLSGGSGSDVGTDGLDVTSTELLEGLDELGVLLNGPVATGLALWRLLVGHGDLGFVELLLENGLQTAHLVAELFVLKDETLHVVLHDKQSVLVLALGMRAGLRGIRRRRGCAAWSGGPRRSPVSGRDREERRG